MESSYTLLQSEIEDSLTKVAMKQGEEIVNQIKPILMKNIGKKRLNVFLEGNPDYLEAYIQVIVENYRLYHSYIYSLQVARDNEVWKPLLDKIETISFAFFRRKNFDNSIQTHEIAKECTSKAAEAIMNANFPYDTSFDAWVVKIVQNKCLKYMAEEMEKRKIPADQQVELNEEMEIFDGSPDVLHQIEEVERHAVIEKALKQISKARRDAIVLKYFDNLSSEDIAKQLGKSIDAVYCLQFNGLRDLRKILAQNRNMF